MLRIMTCAVLVFGLWPVAAQAQAGLLPAKSDVAGSRAQPEFDPLGIRLGPWLAKASVRIDNGYDDNLFGTATQKEGDGFVIVSPSLSVVSDWARHGLDFSAKGGLTRYYSHPRQRSDEYVLRAGGRLELGSTTIVAANASTSLNSERNAANGAPLSTGKPSQYHDTSYQIAVSEDLSPVRLGIALSHGRTRYNDLVNSNGRRITQAFRDSNRWALQGSAIYAPTDVAALGVTAQVQRTDSHFSDRAGTSFSIAGSGAIDLGMIRIEGELGYLQRIYTRSALRDFNGPSYSGTASWYPTSLLAFSVSARRTLENSGNPGVGVIVSQNYRAEASFELLRNFVIQAEVSEKRQNFREIGTRSAIHAQEVKGEYRFNRSVAIGAYARHECRDSTDPSRVRSFCTILTGASLTFRR